MRAIWLGSLLVLLIGCSGKQSTPPPKQNPQPISKPSPPPTQQTSTKATSAAASSTAPASTAASKPLMGEGLRLVLQPRTSFIITVHADASWASGAPSMIGKEGALLLFQRGVAKEKLPEEASGWLGQEVELYRADGVACTAKVSGFSLLGEVYPVEKDELMGHDLTTEKLDDPVIAKEVWDWLEKINSVWLRAELETKGDCTGALFARRASLPKPVYGGSETASAELSGLALKALWEIPEYKSIQEEFQKALPKAAKKNPHWESYGDLAHVEFSTMKASDGTTLLQMQANGSEACQVFDRTLWVVWEVKGAPAAPALSLITATDAVGEQPAVVIDIEGDHSWEFLYQGGLIQKDADGYQTTEELEATQDVEIGGC